ncbi:MAG: hypothetical protein ACREIP_14250, partial [Alphaproteobacteria bacterium]
MIFAETCHPVPALLRRRAFAAGTVKNLSIRAKEEGARAMGRAPDDQLSKPTLSTSSLACLRWLTTLVRGT